MSAEVGMITAIVLVLSAVLTGVVRRVALARGVIDVPNARSSHAIPTPRGGGIAIVLTVSGALLLLLALGKVSPSLVMALVGGGSMVAIVGYIDDRRPLPASVRLFVHFVAAFWALACLGGLPPLQFGEHVVAFGWLGYPLGAVGIVWVLNLFNFMDGIDGIAGAEAAFIAIAGSLLLADCAGSSGRTASSLIFAAACLGFLLRNWPPASIFMGDVGSGYLGFFIAVCAIAPCNGNAVAPLVWLILGGVFFADATATFARRLVRGEPVWAAHNSHAYQQLARRWKSHLRVTLAVLALNLIWLLPIAFFAAKHPRYAGWFALIALGPVLAMVCAAGAGRKS